MPSLFQFFIVLSLITGLFSPAAHAAVRLEMEEGGMKTTIISDTHGMLRLVDHPFKSDFYYDTKNGRFYIVLKEEGFTYFVGTYGLMDAPVGQLKQLPVSETKAFAKFEGAPWLLSTDKGEICGKVYSNKMLGETVGANLSDIASINLALYHIFALEDAKSSCVAYRIPSLLGKWVGFPIGFEKAISNPREQNAKLVRQESIHLDEPYSVSAYALPLTPSAHVRILEKELNEKNHQHFLELQKRLKGQDEIQLKTVKELLKKQWEQPRS